MVAESRDTPGDYAERANYYCHVGGDSRCTITEILILLRPHGSFGKLAEMSWTWLPRTNAFGSAGWRTSHGPSATATTADEFAVARPAGRDRGAVEDAR